MVGIHPVCLDQVSRRSCIVILEMCAEEGRQDIEVMVDAVNEVIDIPMAEIEPALGFGAGINAHLIKGVGKVNGKGVIIFSLDHVLLDDQMLSLGSMSEARFRESEILA